MLSWEYPPHVVGGLARHVDALSRALVAQGHEVHVLTRSAPDQPAEEVLGGVHVYRVSPFFQEPPDFRLWVNHLNFALLEAGVRLLQRLHGPTILHAHDWLVAHAAKGLKTLFRIPLVATIHATENGRQNGLHDDGQKYINDVEWWLTYEAWRVIVCSNAMRAEVQRLFGLGDDKVTVIPNGITSPQGMPVRSLPPRESFAAPDERLLFHIGRLVPEKGAGILLEAMPMLLRQHQVRLVIGGVGPYADELRRRAEHLGVAHRVRFTGWVSDAEAQALYRYADVVAVPSTYEPFGIVALEAMAAGAPVVVSDVGGLSEIIRHGENGLKAHPGNPVSLADQISRLLGEKPLARRLAAAGKREVLERYAWSAVARTTASVYDEVSTACCQTDWCAWAALQAAPPASGTTPGRYTM